MATVAMKCPAVAMKCPAVAINSPAAAAVFKRYGSLLFMERPVHDGDLFSRQHPKMTLLNRAKIFAPFAALVGFDEHIRSKDVQYVWKRLLDADEEWELNRRLNILHSLTYNSRVARENAVAVNIEYYIPCTDPNNDAYEIKGQYKNVIGLVMRVDQVRQEIVVDDGSSSTVIPFADIYNITSSKHDLFKKL